jgi:geranylgeranyl diphosphate synthase type II
VVFADYLKQTSKLIDEYLKNSLPPENLQKELIWEAMEYSLFSGGKRLRPILVILANQAVGGNLTAALPVACAVEFIHTYSLIHDDLPSMDNDDYRRGRLTNHKVYGEAIAILAGDALLTHAFYLLSSNLTNLLSGEQIITIIRELSTAAGPMGMIEGQTADLLSEGQRFSVKQLDYIHNRKTAALIKAALRVGAISGNCSSEQLNILTIYAEKIGLAFQIIDDILDLVGDEGKIGKKTGSDLKNNKLTYPNLYGLEKSKQMAQQLVQEAKNEVSSLFGDEGEYLIALAEYIVKRDY